MRNILTQGFCKHIRAKLCLQLLCYIIPTLMGVILSSTQCKAWILSITPDKYATMFTHGLIQFLIIFLGTVIVPCIIYIIIEYLDFRRRKTGYEILLCLITNIDNVVKEKRARFRKIRENRFKSDQTIFRSITKPTEQIKHLCQAACFIMRLWTNDGDVKSAVFYCKNNKIENILAICGEDKIKASVSELNEKSLAKKALQDTESQIVESIENEELFIKPHGCKAQSAFVVPVYDGSEAVFVICFTSPNKQCFKIREKKRYEAVIDEISSRLMLEWHLFELLKQGSHAK